MEGTGANIVGLWKQREGERKSLGKIKDRVGGGSAPPDKARCMLRADLCDVALLAARVLVDLSILPSCTVFTSDCA